MPAKCKVNWPAVRGPYEEGIRPLSALAVEAGCSVPAIIKHARVNSWVRSPRPERSVVLAPEVDDLCRAGFVYVVFIEADGRRYSKIGMAAHFDSRLKSHQTSSPFEMRVAICYFVGNMRVEEKVLHGMFASKQVRGEWFELSQVDLGEIAARSLLV